MMGADREEFGNIFRAIAHLVINDKKGGYGLVKFWQALNEFYALKSVKKGWYFL